jgi:hypothetical protein
MTAETHHCILLEQTGTNIIGGLDRI